LYTPGGRIIIMLTMVVAGLLTKKETLSNSACFALLLFIGRHANRYGRGENVATLLLALLKKKASTSG
jgi:hypothetical protein